MELSQIYILILIITLLAIALVVFFVQKNKKKNRITTLTAFAFAFVIAGITFGDNRLIGYSLMGIGILLAVIDMIKSLRKK